MSDDVVHLDDEVLAVAPCLLFGCVMIASFQMLARGARAQERRRRLVNVMNDGQVLERRFARGGAAANGNAGLEIVTPHENEWTSISSLCLASVDSPLMFPIFAKMSDAMWMLLLEEGFYSLRTAFRRARIDRADELDVDLFR